MYIADTVGYLGYAAIMLTRAVFPGRETFLGFFTLLAGGLLVMALMARIVAGAAHTAGPRLA